MAAAWPKDNQAARNAFYGDPGKGEIASQMISVVPPFRMTYTDDSGKVTVIKSIMFHRKCADALKAALQEIWDYCQHDQARVDASGASKYFGAYNPRKVRGSATKWSNHAYAAAIDLNAGQNALGAVGNMPQFIVDAFVRQGAMWGGWYKSRPDWMHFEFVDNGGRQPKSAPPVFGAAPPAISAKPVPTIDRRSRMGRTIVGYEARRDKQGNLIVYKLPSNDGGGAYEVASINDRYHPQQAAHLRDLINAGKYEEAEASAVEYIVKYTDVGAGWSTNAGIEFFLRDCVFNRGPTGAAKILQLALGVDDDGSIGPLTREALTKIEAGPLLEKLRAAREQYEDKVAPNRPNLRPGLVNRWNKCLADAKKFAAESASTGKTSSDIVKGVIVATGAAGAATGVQQGWSLMDWVTAAGVAAIVIMALYLAWRHGWPRLKEWLHRKPAYHDQLLGGPEKGPERPAAPAAPLPPPRRNRAPRAAPVKRRGKAKPPKKTSKRKAA